MIPSTEEALDILRKKAEAFDEISEILYPADDFESEWDGGTIERVGEVVEPLATRIAEAKERAASQRPCDVAQALAKGPKKAVDTRSAPHGS